MSEKMLTYEEWDEYYRTEPSGRELFKLARQGMAPVNDPMVIDLRGIKWPDEALSIVCIFSALTVETHEQELPYLIRAIERPAPVWRPKDGEWVWRVEYTTHSLIRWSKRAEGTFFAKPINYVDESVWTRDQFLSRGDVWEVR